MNTQPNLTNRTNENKRWLKASEISYIREGQPVIIYVGQRNVTTTSCYKITATSLDDARQHLKSLGRNNPSNCFNAIIIDKEVTIEDLEKFSVFVRERTACLIICNKERLKKNEVKFIKGFEIVDEIADLNADSLDTILSNAWLKKTEKQQRSFNTSKRAIKQAGKAKAKNIGQGLKRIFDITISAAIILTILPVILLIAIAIKLDSKGPVFYSSPRAGRGYKVFKFFKFRSMIVDADKKIKNLAHLNQYDVNGSGPQFFKLNNDPRVTRVGKFLRNTSLDELPQLLNVLIGDMSLVGNRPLPLYEAATLTTNEYVERFSAPAGITGYWQIKKRGKAEMSVEERMTLDIYYARKASPILDLYIILSTPAALFQSSDV